MHLIGGTPFENISNAFYTQDVKHSLGVLEAAVAAVWGICALEGQIPTSLARRFSIALYLPSLALIAIR